MLTTQLSSKPTRYPPLHLRTCQKSLIWFSSDECLTSSQWEEVDYDLDDAMAGSSTSPTGTSADEVADPLGLGNQIK